MRVFRTTALTALIAGLLIGPAFVPRQAVAEEGHVQGLNQRPTREDVFIRFKSRPGQAEEALVRGQGGTVRHRYTIVNAIAAQIPSQAVQALRNNPNVEAVEPDIEAQAVHIADASDKEVANAWGVDRLDG